MYPGDLEFRNLSLVPASARTHKSHSRRRRGRGGKASGGSFCTLFLQVVTRSTPPLPQDESVVERDKLIVKMIEDIIMVGGSDSFTTRAQDTPKAHLIDDGGRIVRTSNGFVLAPSNSEPTNRYSWRTFEPFRNFLTTCTITTPVTHTHTSTQRQRMKKNNSIMDRS